MSSNDGTTRRSVSTLDFSTHSADDLVTALAPADAAASAAAVMDKDKQQLDYNKSQAKDTSNSGFTIHRLSDGTFGSHSLESHSDQGTCRSSNYSGKPAEAEAKNQEGTQVKAVEVEISKTKGKEERSAEALESIMNMDPTTTALLSSSTRAARRKRHLDDAESGSGGGGR